MGAGTFSFSFTENLAGSRALSVDRSNLRDFRVPYIMVDGAGEDTNEKFACDKKEKLRDRGLLEPHQVLIGKQTWESLSNDKSHLR